MDYSDLVAVGDELGDCFAAGVKDLLILESGTA
jgi:hypothetical protein